MTKNNLKDLTVGSPTGLILGFSLPLLLGMLFQQVYSLMDTIIVGRFLSVSALAAVGSTGSNGREKPRMSPVGEPTVRSFELFLVIIYNPP